MSGLYLSEGNIFHCTGFCGVGAALRESASRLGVDRVGDLAAYQLRLSSAHRNVRHRYSGQQRPGIWVQRAFEQVCQSR